METAVVCDYEFERLECRANGLLNIRVAVYGDHGIDMLSVLNAGCIRSRGLKPCVANVSSIVQSMCQNRPSCGLFPHRSTFNANPCPGRRMYLLVRYNCIQGTANQSTDTTPTFASSTAFTSNLENLQTTNWDTSTAGGRPGGERNIGAITGGIIAGCLILFLIAAVIIAFLRRRNASRTVHGHHHHESPSASDAITKVKKPIPPIAGDDGYEDPDKFSPETGQSLQNMPGYETVDLRPGNDAYADYDTSHRKISDTYSYITPAAVPGNDGYEEPQRFTQEPRQCIENMPGYETVDCGARSDRYTAYDTSHRRESDVNATVSTDGDYEEISQSTHEADGYEPVDYQPGK